MTVTTNFWKSDEPVSRTQELWKLLGQFFKTGSMQEGLWGFLKHVSLFIIPVILKLEQTFLTDETPMRKLHEKRTWSYSVRHRSMFLLSSARWFDNYCFFRIVRATKYFSYYIDLLLCFSSLLNIKCLRRFHPCQNGKVHCNRLIKTDLEWNFCFVSDIKSIAVFPCTWWVRKSNLLLMKLIFK